MTDLLQQTITYDPFNGKYPYALGNLEKYRQQDQKALNNYIKAAMKQPMDGSFLMAAGRMLSSSDPVKAQQLIEIGYRRSGKNKDLSGGEQ